MSPIDLLINMDEQKKKLLNEADLLALVGKLLSRWKFISVATFCAAIFGVIIALSTVKSFTTEVVVAPESSSSSFSSSGIGSLASMVGLDFGMGDGSDAIYPMLYPDIVSSLPFLSALFDVRVRDLDGNVDTTYYAYLKHYQQRTWLDGVKELPGKAVAWVKSLASSSESVAAGNVFNPYNLSKSQMKMVDDLNGKITVFVDKKTNVLTVSFTERDPRVAAIMAETITLNLKKEITEYRTKKAVDDCDYIESLYVEAKDSLEVAQKRYADFVDSHKNVTKELVIIERDRLMADKELKTTIFSQWAQQLLLAKAKVQEKTPVFVALKPASIPVRASSISRAMMVILYAFLGFIFSAAYVLFKEQVIALWYKISRKEK